MPHATPDKEGVPVTTALRAADTKRERLSIQTIRRTLDPEAVGKHLYLFDEVESTNAVLRDLARSGAAVGTVVLAESQRQGRGRLGRPWFSPPDVNLYAAVLLGPRLRLKEAGPLSFIGSLAVSDAIRELGLSPSIKWPNDVLLGREKVAGALLEWVPFSADTGSAVIGVGVNLNVDVELLRRALGPDGGRATSVAAVLGRPVDRSRFAASFLGHLDRWTGYTPAEEPVPDPCTAAQQDHGNHRNGRDAGPHDGLPSTLTDGPTKRKPFHARNRAPQRPSRRSHSRITPGASDDSGWTVTTGSARVPVTLNVTACSAPAVANPMMLPMIGMRSAPSFKK